MAEAERSSAVQFSGGEKEVIERKIDVSTDALATRKDINNFYEISRCVDVIKSHGFEKVMITTQLSLFQFFQTFTTLSVHVTDINTEKSFCTSLENTTRKRKLSFVYFDLFQNLNSLRLAAILLTARTSSVFL